MFSLGGLRFKGGYFREEVGGIVTRLENAKEDNDLNFPLTSEAGSCTSRLCRLTGC